MKIRDCMTCEVRIVGPDDTIADAARAMAEADVGGLPVGDADQLVGFITDRDITVRGIAGGISPQRPVRDLMSREVAWCMEDDDVSDVLMNMGDLQVRRMPVLDAEKRLVGIVSLCDMAEWHEQVAGSALTLIAREGGLHTQSLH